MIVTVSMEYGTGATSIARDAAASLGYELIDRQLPVIIAKRLRISPEAVEAAEDSRRSIGERLLTGLELSTPEIGPVERVENFDESLFREVQTAVRECAAQGDAVIVGRAAGLILGRRSDVVRIFMHAPREWRIERIVSEMGTDAKTAAAEVDRIDAARRAYVKDWYDVRWGDPAHYDLSIDVSTFGHHICVALIVATVSAHRNT